MREAEKDEHPSSRALSSSSSSSSGRHSGSSMVRWSNQLLRSRTGQVRRSGGNNSTSSPETSSQGSQASRSNMSPSALCDVRALMTRPIQLPPVPARFRCPCCSKVMVDPVVAADGMTFERACIAPLLQAGTIVSPVTGKCLESVVLFPDVALRQASADCIKLRDHIKQEHEEWLRGLAKAERSFYNAVAGIEKEIIALGKTPRSVTSGKSRDGEVEELARAPFSAGAAPRRPGSGYLKVMREQQRQEMAGKGHWWARLCRGC